jgi:zinc transporter
VLVTDNRVYLLILRAVDLTVGADPFLLISLRMWLDAERLITLRSKRVMAPSQLRDRLDEGLVAQSPAALMVTLTTLITDNLAELIEDLGEAIGELEEASLGDDLLEKRELVAQHQRRIIAFRRHITPQVHALGRLRAEAPLLHEHSTALRELENRSQRILEELTHLAERGHLLKTEVSEAHTRKADDRMRLLTVLGALFLPLSFLTGLLGINVGGIPGADEGLAFWIVCGAMFGLFVLQLLWLRWRGWI